MSLKQQKEHNLSEELNSNQHNDADALESVLSHVGSMGLYQKLLFVAMMPFGIFYAFVYCVQMFIVATPQNHWCRVPALANLSMEWRKNLSAPVTSSGEIERCMTFVTNWTYVLETMTPPPEETPMIPCQHGWEFDRVDIPYETIVSERGWVCGSASYIPIAQSFFFAGSLFGAMILGYIADQFGRVPALIGANLIGGIGGVATIFTSGVWDFIFCRFLAGIAYDNCFMMVYILVLEYVGTQYRTLVGATSIALYFGAGSMALPWIALWANDWRLLMWITSLPMFIVILAPWLLPESARWLASTGRINQAVKVLKRFETINGTKIPDNIMGEFIVSSNTGNKKESYMALFKSAPLRKSMVLMVLYYMGGTAIFDGLVRLSDSFGLDFFVTFTLTSATEIPSIAFLVVVLDRWGRRNLGFGPMTLTGVLILIALFVPKGITQAALAITARFFLNMSYCASIQWATEILPTPFRASGSSILHMTGYVATAMSPFIIYSEHIWSKLPLLFMGIISLISAGISLLLPETQGKQMPQTVTDSENIIRQQRLCGKPEND
ncbi:unnamed protein product [Arctia plantaginis]|uniref:Major facilitator superfamily (MFS) profile domain-containing protein n=1 Tax=Arctia plantaginis TaxID=874455 RepID=A0A8S0YND3_ARCPL|nr:unnamed protein product [Arctia plantaginis]